ARWSACERAVQLPDVGWRSEPRFRLVGAGFRDLDGLCRGKPFCADEDLPRLNPRREELLGGHPGIVGKPAVDLGLALRVHDEERADASILAAGERAADDEE